MLFFLIQKQSLIIPPFKTISAQNKSSAILPSGKRKNGLLLLGEIYEMEDTRPRLLIKIINFVRAARKFAAVSIDGFFSLLYLILPLSPVLSIFLFLFE